MLLIEGNNTIPDIVPTAPFAASTVMGVESPGFLRTQSLASNCFTEGFRADKPFFNPFLNEMQVGLI